MYAVSNDFLALLNAPSMTAVTLVVASDGTTLWVDGGSVQMDSRRNIGRTCDLTLVETDTLDLDALYDLVMTPTLEITVYRGLEVNGINEYVPLGVFSTDNARQLRDRIEWNGSDRAKKISRARFIDAYQITSGSTLAAAGADLLTSRWSFTPTDFSNVTETIQAQIVYEAGESSDPWAQARQLFEDHGYDLNFDGRGTARAQVVPDPATVSAVFDCGTGETNLLIDGETVGSFEQTFNGVIATGEGSNIDTPVRAEVWDTDPSSPTYYLSGFGLVPKFYSSPLLTTTEACTKAATTLLAKSKGRLEQFSVSGVVNPALEPLDVISATLYGSSSRYVIDRITVPLRVTEPMQIVARETSTT